jgi:DNA replication protein DnaC
VDQFDFDPDAVVRKIRAKADAMSAEEIDAIEAEIEESERRLRLRVAESWAVPRRVLDVLSERPRVTEGVQAVKAWQSRSASDWCLVLSGPPGVGKSIAAAWWLAHEARDRRDVPNAFPCWWTAGKLARVSGYDGTIDRVGKVGPLVIDDLGTEYGDANGYWYSRLDELLDQRYSNNRRTILTTNLNASEFRERYGERIVDRIREATTHAFVGLEGASLR